MAKGILNNISKMRLGYQGKRPLFNGETKSSTLHNQSSNAGFPRIGRPQSILDENDPHNTNYYKSRKGLRYNDNLPK